MIATRESSASAVRGLWFELKRWTDWPGIGLVVTPRIASFDWTAPIMLAGVAAKVLAGDVESKAA